MCGSAWQQAAAKIEDLRFNDQQRIEKTNLKKKSKKMKTNAKEKF